MTVKKMARDALHITVRGAESAAGRAIAEGLADAARIERRRTPARDGSWDQGWVARLILRGRFVGYAY
jgi:hypothetical protein